MRASGFSTREDGEHSCTRNRGCGRVLLVGKPARESPGACFAPSECEPAGCFVAAFGSELTCGGRSSDDGASLAAISKARSRREPSRATYFSCTESRRAIRIPIFENRGGRVRLLAPGSRRWAAYRLWAASSSRPPRSGSRSATWLWCGGASPSASYSRVAHSAPSWGGPCGRPRTACRSSRDSPQSATRHPDLRVRYWRTLRAMPCSDQSGRVIRLEPLLASAPIFDFLHVRLGGIACDRSTPPRAVRRHGVALSRTLRRRPLDGAGLRHR